MRMENILEREAFEATASTGEWITNEILSIGEKNEINGEPTEVIAGDLEDAENWHIQSEGYSCAISCQEFVAEQLLDREFSEQELIEFAKEKGWYESGVGTTQSDVGNILEALGLNVERVQNCSLEKLVQSLNNGEKVICGVNNMILADYRMADMPGLQANHAVEVIGVDCSDPENVQVILNDPGIENGKAIRHDLDAFLKAWNTGDNYAVIAGKG